MLIEKGVLLDELFWVFPIWEKISIFGNGFFTARKAKQPTSMSQEKKSIR